MRIDNPTGQLAALTGSFSGSFVGDGSQITGVTGEWDGSLNGDAEITGSIHLLNGKYGQTGGTILSGSDGAGGGQVSGLGGGAYDPGAGVNVSTFTINGTTYSGILNLRKDSTDEYLIYEFSDTVYHQAASGNSLQFIPNGDTAAAVDIATDGSILPATTEAQDLGSTSKRWRDLYLSSGSLLIGPLAKLSATSTGVIEFTNSGTNAPLPIVTSKVTLDDGANTVNLELASDGRLITTDTAGDHTTGIYSGSFSGSFEGDGSGLTGVAPIAGDGISVNGTTVSVDSGSLAGAGIGTSAGALVANVDDTTIEINTDTLRIKDDGVTAAKLDDVFTNGGGTAGTFGSATQIPSVTIDGQGRITTASLKSISTDLTVGADVGSNDVVSLSSDVLTIAGGTGVETTITDNQVSVAIGQAVGTADNVTFNDIVATGNLQINGTGSFAYIQSTTGSAKIIGDAYIVLNNNTPSERYAGIKIFDSGSAGVTSSLEFDGQTNDWFYEYSDDGGATAEHGVLLFGPGYNTKGTHTYPTSNKLLKGSGDHHIVDSTITDTGALVTVSNPLTVTGLASLDGGIDADGAFTVADTTGNVSTTGTLDVTGLASLDGGIDVNGELFTVSTAGDTKADSLGVGTAASGTTGEIRATGDITAFYSSDERLKENFKPLDGALDKVKDLNGYEFDWKDGIEDIVSKKGHDIGVKAQELQTQFPELVHERDNGYLAVDYVKLTAVLLHAVKELSAKVDELSK